MNKPLSEMTLLELWELFPIILKEHNTKYKKWYEDEKSNIFSIVGISDICRINHIGSSAVPGLIAKPTIDILLEISDNCDVFKISENLKNNDWILMSEESKPDLNLVFNKGYTPNGFAKKVYHLHVRLFGDWGELYFRDYLLEYPETALKYGNLKVKLAEKFRHDRDGYTASKGDFIKEVTDKARILYVGRYEELDPLL
jgi:GrpB-like predicted nucleotidyltransferase (UPF0157 family)